MAVVAPRIRAGRAQHSRCRRSRAVSLHLRFPVFDWVQITEAVARIGTGTTYEWTVPAYREDYTDYVYRYSPLLPYVMAPFVAAGLGAWRLVHIAALFVLPFPIWAVVLIAGPFWFDVANANFLTFVLVSGWFAISGDRWGIAAYFSLTALLPRPLMVPLALWLLWRRPESRIIAIVIGCVAVVLTAATGELVPWLEAMLRGTDMIGTKFDWGPGRVIGPWWIPIGTALSVWLTLRGHLGLAGLAVSPYALPYYLLIMFWELNPDARSTSSRQNEDGVARPVPGSAPQSLHAHSGCRCRADPILVGLRPSRRLLMPDAIT